MTKEEEILKAAEEEFFRNGYDATSTATIAKNAGVTHAMVNYYFRNKERLFIQILDNHVYGLLKDLKPLMSADGKFVRITVNAAEVIFDKLAEDRHFPYLLSDIARTHPEFLSRYRETFDTVCKESIRKHEILLGQSIADGSVSECTMKDVYNSVITLASAPFMVIPLLENVAGMTPEQIDVYLSARRKEMVRILLSRYSGKE